MSPFYFSNSVAKCSEFALTGQSSYILARIISILEIKVIRYKTFDVFLNGMKFNVQENSSLHIESLSVHSCSRDCIECPVGAPLEAPESVEDRNRITCPWARERGSSSSLEFRSTVLLSSLSLVKKWFP